MLVDFKEDKKIISFLDDPTNLSGKNSFEQHNIFYKQEKEQYKIHFFSKTSKSINIQTLQFTNFIKSKEKKEYRILKYLYNNIKNIENNMASWFEMPDEITNSNQDKIKRLQSIIFHNTGIKVKNITNLYKSRCKIKREHFPLRIYTKIRKNNLYIYLIDLYHLAWTSTYYKTDDPKIQYEKHKTDNLCMSVITE